MTSAEYRAALASRGLTQGAAAKLLNIGIRTSNGYANDRPIPEHVALQLNTPDTLIEHVARALRRKDVICSYSGARAAIDAYHDYIRRHS